MRFVNIKGVQHIILEESDQIRLTTEDALENMSIDIECVNYGLNISGNSSLVNKISGDGMIEKVFIPPVLSSEKIIEKCDQWLEMFKKVHDKFKELVLTDKYRKQNISMELSFCSFISFSDINVKGEKIGLNLNQFGNIIQEGITISMDKSNETIYQYLLANVLDYYISKNYKDTPIDNLDLSWNHILYSADKKQDKSTVPMIANLNNLYDSKDYARIVTSIIVNHNLGISSEQIISNLKNNIYNQQLSEWIDRDINQSTRQLEHIIPDLDSKKTFALEKKK